MYQHHTKVKGDSGLGFVVADLLSNGLQVALPISEHLPFDCIVINQNGDMVRLSVKYRSVDRYGNINVALKSSWSNAKGCQSKQYDKQAFDATAIYCPETRVCYYVRNVDIDNQSTFTLRINKPKQAQAGIRLAENFIGASRLFC